MILLEKDNNKDIGWKTTKNDHKVYLDSKGNPTKGNPHVISKMNSSKSNSTNTKKNDSKKNTKTDTKALLKKLSRLKDDSNKNKVKENAKEKTGELSSYLLNLLNGRG